MPARIRAARGTNLEVKSALHFYHFREEDTRGSFGDVEGLEKFLADKYGADAGRLLSGGRAELPLTITCYPSIKEFRGERSIGFVVTKYC